MMEQMVGNYGEVFNPRSILLALSEWPQGGQRQGKDLTLLAFSVPAGRVLMRHNLDIRTRGASNGSLLLLFIVRYCHPRMPCDLCINDAVGGQSLARL